MHADHHDGEERAGDHQREHPAASGSPSSTASVRLPEGRRCARRAGCWPSAARRPAGRCRPRRRPPSARSVPPARTSCRARRRDRRRRRRRSHRSPRSRTASGRRCRPTQPRRRDADRHEPPRGERRQHQTGGRRRRSAERRHLDGPRRGHAGPHQPRRTHPVRVGAPDAVGIVVRVVDPDLERERHDEREAATEGGEAAERVPGTAAHQDRGDRGGQRPRSGRGHPLLRGCHVHRP